MTDDTMALRTLLEKSPDADFLREILLTILNAMLKTKTAWAGA
jgi:hypothetical protein